VVVLAMLYPVTEVPAADVATPVEGETFDVQPCGTSVVTDTTLYCNGRSGSRTSPTILHLFPECARSPSCWRYDAGRLKCRVPVERNTKPRRHGSGQDPLPLSPGGPEELGGGVGRAGARREQHRPLEGALPHTVARSLMDAGLQGGRSWKKGRPLRARRRASARGTG
jgi:hypothetical protein